MLSIIEFPLDLKSMGLLKEWNRCWRIDLFLLTATLIITLGTELTSDVIIEGEREVYLD